MNRVLPSAEEARRLVESWYKAGLEAVDPRKAVINAVAWDGIALEINGERLPLAPGGKVIGVAIGKAASEMALGLQSVMGERLSVGIVLTKDGHLSGELPGWSTFEASHPVPDQRGVAATRTILELVSALAEEDTVLVLVSGGGSALLEAPREPLALSDIQEVTRLLLRAGAPIQDLNAVRSELSEVKGGGLRRAIGEARCISLILSDVLGNDPTVIASGPTIARSPNPTKAVRILESYGVLDVVPQPVRDLLSATSVPSEPSCGVGDEYVVIGDNDMFIDRVTEAAESDGFRVAVVQRLAEGEATILADSFLDLAIHSLEDADVVIGGGEATVTVTGDGFGGRNTEFALAAAIRLDREHRNLVVASLASDGQDGSVDAAGAIVDVATVASGLAKGLDAQRYLHNNDSGGYFERAGLLVKPGPTGTNVNDVYIAIRVRPA